MSDTVLKVSYRLSHLIFITTLRGGTFISSPLPMKQLRLTGAKVSHYGDMQIGDIIILLIYFQIFNYLEGRLTETGRDRKKNAYIWFLTVQMAAAGRTGPD